MASLRSNCADRQARLIIAGHGLRRDVRLHHLLARGTGPVHHLRGLRIPVVPDEAVHPRRDRQPQFLVLRFVLNAHFFFARGHLNFRRRAIGPRHIARCLLLAVCCPLLFGGERADFVAVRVEDL
jgi:hypothetical protein